MVFGSGKVNDFSFCSDTFFPKLYRSNRPVKRPSTVADPSGGGGVGGGG